MGFLAMMKTAVSSPTIRIAGIGLIAAGALLGGGLLFRSSRGTAPAVASEETQTEAASSARPDPPASPGESKRESTGESSGSKRLVETTVVTKSCGYAPIHYPGTVGRLEEGRIAVSRRGTVGRGGDPAGKPGQEGGRLDADRPARLRESGQGDRKRARRGEGKIRGDEERSAFGRHQGARGENQGGRGGSRLRPATARPHGAARREEGRGPVTVRFDAKPVGRSGRISGCASRGNGQGEGRCANRGYSGDAGRNRRAGNPA